MQDYIMELEKAISNLINKNASDLEENLHVIVQLSTILFPKIMMVYMEECMQDRLFEAEKWVDMYGRITSISSLKDGFVMYDLLYNDIYKSIEEFCNIAQERKIVIE